MKAAGILLTALLCCQFANGLRILGVFPVHARSHWSMTGKLMSTLAQRGHRVDVITNFPLKAPIPNYTDISITRPLEQVINSLTASNLTELTSQDLSIMVERIGNSMCKVLGLPQVQQLIKNPPNDPPYDLVIVEVRFFQLFSVYFNTIVMLCERQLNLKNTLQTFNAKLVGINTD